MHRDHLGSIEAISNGGGYFKSRMSFDAWGNRRLDNWTRGNPTITSPTKQGYTGHEQLDQHKLVHMQGRVYDPQEQHQIMLREIYKHILALFMRRVQAFLWEPIL